MPMNTYVRLALVIPLGVGLIGSPVTAQPQDQDDGIVAIQVLSNRADLVSGGRALVEIRLPDGVDASGLDVRLDDRPITDAFGAREGLDGRFVGLVEGLQQGDNELTVTLPQGGGATLIVTNRSSTGPVFSGTQVQPWLCRTQQHGLGPPTDEDNCHAPTAVEYFYRPTNSNSFSSYDPENPPSNVAMTTTDEGHTVPYIVRRERGTINRGIYDLALLFNPSEPWEPWAPQPGWNGKLLYRFGGGCGPSHVQGGPSGVLHLDSLSRGFAVASTGLNTFSQNCNDVVSAEAVAMLKEHLVESYGEIRYTIGEGCSAASMQHHLIGANYPGLLDGIIPTCSYPDYWSMPNVQVHDCKVLLEYFLFTSPHLWQVERQRNAVTGYASDGACLTRRLLFQETTMNPSQGSCGLPQGEVYHPENNPTGVRCTIQDYMVAVFGQREEDGFANRPVDNVGVQYGLAALRAGVITTEQFVDLNEKVGGLDIDWQHQPGRTLADPDGLEHLYRSGRVSHGYQLAKMPILDMRGSGTSNHEFHNDVHSHVMRARLLAHNGHANNHVMWVAAGGVFGQPPAAVVLEGFLLMDEWLAAIEADDSEAPLEQKVVGNRPAGATDGCWIEREFVSDQFLCRTAFPYNGFPRLMAGSPLAADIMKCQLTPLNRSDDYGLVQFTDSQWQRLEAAFPDGMCDWTKPGVSQQPPAGPWMSFADGPGGRPLGPPPESTPFGPGVPNSSP